MFMGSAPSTVEDTEQNDDEPPADTIPPLVLQTWLIFSAEINKYQLLSNVLY
jgi:hypothetical protein